MNAVMAEPDSGRRVEHATLSRFTRRPPTWGVPD